MFFKLRSPIDLDIVIPYFESDFHTLIGPFSSPLNMKGFTIPPKDSILLFSSLLCGLWSVVNYFKFHESSLIRKLSENYFYLRIV